MSTPTSALSTIERPMRADARRNRERILEAARELFAREEPDVQMDELARRAGVGVGTVYRHFPDKEALMGELVRERFRGFNERLRRALDALDEAAPGGASQDARGDDAFDALTRSLRANAASVAEDAATRFAFMSGGERVFAHAESEREQFMALATDLVARARATGRLHPDFAAHDIPMVMCGVCATIGRGKEDWDWKRHLEIMIRGMGS